MLWEALALHFDVSYWMHFVNCGWIDVGACGTDQQTERFVVTLFVLCVEHRGHVPLRHLTKKVPVLFDSLFHSLLAFIYIQGGVMNLSNG